MPTPTEEAFYEIAKRALPRWFTEDDGNNEVLRAMAAQWAVTSDQVRDWTNYTLITLASELWLEQHARDRGTERRDGESVEDLRARLRSDSNLVSFTAFDEYVRAVLDAAGVTYSDPYPVVVSLAEVLSYYGPDDTAEWRAFFDRGYRMGHKPPLAALVILPLGTTESTRLAIETGLQQRAAAGHTVIVERRTS